MMACTVISKVLQRRRHSARMNISSLEISNNLLNEITDTV